MMVFVVVDRDLLKNDSEGEYLRNFTEA